MRAVVAADGEVLRGGCVVDDAALGPLGPGERVVDVAHPPPLELGRYRLEPDGSCTLIEARPKVYPVSEATLQALDRASLKADLEAAKALILGETGPLPVAVKEL